MAKKRGVLQKGRPGLRVTLCGPQEDRKEPVFFDPEAHKRFVKAMWRLKEGVLQ